MTTENLFARFYGTDEEKGPSLRDNFETFIEAMQRRRVRHEPVVIVIDGRETGVGKSTLAMHICRRLDPGFGLEKITYSARETLDLYASAPPGSMVDWDESVLGLLTRKGTRDEELTGIISALSIVRKNEIGTVLTVPKIRMLDTLVYNGLAPIWLFVEARGRVRVHRAYKGAQVPEVAAEDRLRPVGEGQPDGVPEPGPGSAVPEGHGARDRAEPRVLPRTVPDRGRQAGPAAWASPNRGDHPLRRKRSGTGRIPCVCVRWLRVLVAAEVRNGRSVPAMPLLPAR